MDRKGTGTMMTSEYQMFEVRDDSDFVISEYSHRHEAVAVASYEANEQNRVYSVHLKRVRTTTKLVGYLLPQKRMGE